MIEATIEVIMKGIIIFYYRNSARKPYNKNYQKTKQYSSLDNSFIRERKSKIYVTCNYCGKFGHYTNNYFYIHSIWNHCPSNHSGPSI